MTDQHAESRAYTPEQLALWADRIADGRDEFPSALAKSDSTQLSEFVRERLRSRLIRHIARAIADRLGQETKESPK